MNEQISLVANAGLNMFHVSVARALTVFSGCGMTPRSTGGRRKEYHKPELVGISWYGSI